MCGRPSLLTAWSRSSVVTIALPLASCPVTMRRTSSAISALLLVTASAAPCVGHATPPAWRLSPTLLGRCREVGRSIAAVPSPTRRGVCRLTCSSTTALPKFSALRSCCVTADVSDSRFARSVSGKRPEIQAGARDHAPIEMRPRRVSRRCGRRRSRARRELPRHRRRFARSRHPGLGRCALPRLARASDGAAKNGPADPTDLGRYRPGPADHRLNRPPIASRPAATVH